MSYIEDGGGKGYKQGVDSEGRGRVAAVAVSQLHHRSMEHQAAYIVLFKHIQQIGDTEEAFGYLLYSGDRVLVVDHLELTCNDADWGHFEIYLNPTVVAGGVDKDPVNLAAFSSKTLSVTTKDTNDGATPLTESTKGSQLYCEYTGLEKVLNFHGGLLLHKGDILYLTSDAKNAATKVRASVHYYECEEDSI